MSENPQATSEKPDKTKMNDKQCAAVISKAIGDVIRISTNKDFRKTCYSIMKVSDTVQCQTKINKKLVELTRKPGELSRPSEAKRAKKDG